MKLTIPLRIPSDNEIWGFANGRRYKTAVYKQFEKDVQWFLKPNPDIATSKSLQCTVKLFFPRPGMRDVSNVLKALGDVLTTNKIILDDRYIQRWEIEKFKGDDRAEIEIKSL